MALVSLSASGLWSSATLWPNGNKPTASDDVYSNGFTAYIDQNVTVNSINSNGGTFRNAGNFTLNANVSAGTSTCLTLTGNGTNTFVVSGANIIGSKSTTSIYAIQVTNSTSTNTLALTTIGNIIGPNVTTSTVLFDAGQYTHLGSSIGGTATNAHGISFSNSNNYPAIIFLSGGPFSAGSGNTSSGFTTQQLLVGASLASSSITVIGTLSGGPGSGGGGSTSGLYLINTSIPANITGNVYGGIGYGFHGGGPATHNIVGTIYSGPAGGTGSVGVYNAAATTTINITGDVYAVNTTGTSYGVQNGSNGTVNIVGNIYGSPATNAGAAVYSNNNNRITITGNVSAGNVSNAYGVYCNNISYLTIYGNVTGGAGGNAYGVLNNNTGYAIISGTAVGGTGSNAHGVFNSSTGTVYVKRARGNAYGPGSAVTNVAYGVTSNSQGSNSIVEELEFGANGLMPVFGNITLADRPTNVVDFFVAGGSRKTLIDPNSASIMPPVSSVRLGVSYSGDNLVGTCTIPSISSVDFGTSVDNSTGIAALFASDIWNTTNNTLTAASLSGTIGYRLRNAATAEIVGQQIAAYNT
jgi:hypothetical protein